MFEQKAWKDRESEYPTRRKLTKEDGSNELVTVERSEGSVLQEGDAFSAENMNDLEKRIGDEFGQVLYVVSFDASTGTLVTKTAGYEE